MPRTSKITDALAVMTALVLLVALTGCGSSSKGSAASAPTSKSKSTAAPADGGSSSDPCKLLTDDEVTGVIGAHAKGATGILAGGLYGPSTCVWKSTDTSGTSVDSLEVSELSGVDADAAREDAAAGAPAPSLGHNARFLVSYARLWFDCGSGELCYVRVATGKTTTHSGEPREDAAIKLARQILTRV